MWVRGLKRCLGCPPIGKAQVASHVGAWIETGNIWVKLGLKSVASHVGAWIETHQVNSAAKHLLSHPMWVRGLKRKV